MISDQNALMIATLLSPWGGIKISHGDVVKLPTYFAEGIIPVMHGMPPYDYFAIKPKKGRIPIHRTDVGLVILGDLIGSRRIIFVKDEDGLYSDDPKKNPEAEFIPEIGAMDLMQRDQDDLVIERPCLEIIQNSEVIEQVQIINGTVPGNITKPWLGSTWEASFISRFDPLIGIKSSFQILLNKNGIRISRSSYALIG